MTELLVGTKKGLFRLEGEPGEQFAITGRWFAGEPVEFAMRDARTGRAFACVTSAFYGPKLFYSDDLAGEWQQASRRRAPRGDGEAARAALVGRPGRGRRTAVRRRSARASSSRAATEARPGS